MIIVVWAALGALAGVAILVGVWSVRAIAQDLREERAEREALHGPPRHARAPRAAQTRPPMEKPRPVSAPPGPGTPSMGPGAGRPFPPVTTATCPGGPTSLKVDSPAPADVLPLPAREDRPAAVSPPAAAGPTLPDSVTEALSGLRRTVAELAKPSDEERWPDLAPSWEDSTGTFTAICGGAP